MNWTEAEETIIARIAATETMHDPENTTGDRRITCSHPEALRRLRRRTKAGVYREPTGAVLAAATIPVDAELSPAQLAHLAGMRSKRLPTENSSL
jgi:hypothetical protein